MYAPSPAQPVIYLVELQRKQAVVRGLCQGFLFPIQSNVARVLLPPLQHAKVHSISAPTPLANGDAAATAACLWLDSSTFAQRRWLLEWWTSARYGLCLLNLRWLTHAHLPQNSVCRRYH